MADRTFFQDVFARNGSADARNNYVDGISNRIFKCFRNRLFVNYRFNRFDILRFNPRRGIYRRAFFRTARRQRLCRRCSFNSVFYSADYFVVSDESVSKELIKGGKQTDFIDWEAVKSFRICRINRKNLRPEIFSDFTLNLTLW